MRNTDVAEATPGFRFIVIDLLRVVAIVAAFGAVFAHGIFLGKYNVGFFRDFDRHVAVGPAKPGSCKAGMHLALTYGRWLPKSICIMLDGEPSTFKLRGAELNESEQIETNVSLVDQTRTEIGLRFSGRVRFVFDTFNSHQHVSGALRQPCR